MRKRHRFYSIQVENSMNRTLKSNKLNIALTAALVVVSAGFGVAGHAATSAADLGVSAQILDSCTIAATPVAFGDYDHHAGSDKAATGSVTETCTNGTAAKITLGQGLNPKLASVDGVPLRQMASGTNRMAYFLYSDEGAGTLWGNTPATGVSQAGTGDEGISLTVYGFITAGQNVPVGSYADTVVATVTF
jgi:spore coat protein U-like protein